ncbi:MAG: HNH endonuclease [Verrucomicrobia bacterium]|nr:HNH endonuclease [Verrucomicrobiota bacterium]
MDARLRQFVRQRANFRCEYCGIREDQETLFAFHVEHIIPRKHAGATHPDNLALACLHCNACKGTNVAGYDPDTGQLTRLFDPRRDQWSVHFAREGARIVGLTPVGRVTVWLLRMNEDNRPELRVVL